MTEARLGPQGHKERLRRRGILLLTGCGAFVVALVVLRIVLDAVACKYDPVTGCCTKHPLKGHTAVLIDKSDPMTPIEIREIVLRIQQLQAQIPKNGVLSIFLINDESAEALDPKFCMCNPGTAANPLYQNPKFIQARWDSAFGKPLEDALTNVFHVEVSTSSPILEAIKFVSESPRFADATEGRRLVILSDMIQNTDVLDQYKRPVTFDDFRKTEHYRDDAPALRDVDVEIDYLERPQYKGFQTASHRDFWRDYFRAAGARDPKFRMIAGGKYTGHVPDSELAARRPRGDTQRETAPLETRPAEAVAIVGSASGAPGTASPGPSHRESAAELHVSVRPAEALILLDDQPRSQGMLSTTVAPGMHRLELRTAGYVTIREEILFAGGTTTQRSYDLVRSGSSGDEPAPSPADSTAGR